MPQRHAALISLGCAKNLSDSEDLVTALRTVDIGLTDQLETADVVLVNTCGFIEDAKKESIGHILDAAEGKRDDAMLVVAGCLTERYLEDLRRDMPEVDCFLPFNDYNLLPGIVRERFADLPEHRLSHDQRSQLTPPHHAFLKIAEGCDNTCNFCAIPIFRGKHISRPFEELVQQAKVYAERGIKEINLISQHLDYYGQDLYGKARLPELIRELARVAPGSWIRLHYCYPNDFTDELIDAMATTPGVVPYIDMPIQHGSDRVLATMGRKTTRGHIHERLEKIRQAMPTAVLRSTFIVGFPGERDEDVAELIDFLQTERLDQVGCFKYSDEEGTTAAKMPKKVDPQAIEERHDAVMATQAEVHAQALEERWLGRELTVLVDEQLDFDLYRCRHYGQAAEVDNATLVGADGLEVGSWARVQVVDHEGYDLVARLEQSDVALDPFTYALG